MSAASVPILHVPELLADVWRIVFFLLCCGALTASISFILTEPVLSRRILMSSIVLLVASWIATNIIRWGEVIYLLGLPVQTVAVILVIVGLSHWTREPASR